MEGLWLEDQNLSFREDIPKPDPTPGEELIKMELAGICNTIIKIIKGYSPFTGVLGPGIRPSWSAGGGRN